MQVPSAKGSHFVKCVVSIHIYLYTFLILVSISDSRGLEVGEVECREKEPCLSGGKGTALAVQLRGDQVHCLLVANIYQVLTVGLCLVGR